MEENRQEPLNPETETDNSKQKKWTGKKLALLICGITVGALILAYAGICVAAHYSETIFPGTMVLGVDLGGETRESAGSRWENKSLLATRANAIPLLVEEERLGSASLYELGVTVKTEDAVEAAWAASHGGNFLTNGFALLRSWLVPTSVVPKLQMDLDALETCVEDLILSLGRTVVDGEIRFAKEHTDGFYVVKPLDGRQINTQHLSSALKSALEAGKLEPIVCQYDVVTAKPVNLEELSAQQGEMSNAAYDHKTGGVLADKLGLYFDLEQAKAALEEAKPGSTILVPGTVVFPKVTAQELEEVMFRDVLGTYTTYVSGTWARKTNVRLAAEKIHNKIYNPGESFDYNTEVGERTRAAGFQAAPAYVGGKTVDEVGGGICQVSSTLYYSALLSNLEIVRRDCHSYAPSYITFGCDATVSWGGPEFTFRNDTDYPIKITTTYSNNNLTVTIHGTKVDDTYVRMVSRTLSVKNYDVVYEETDELAPGVEVVEQSPYTGYYVKTWRNVYSGDGTLISSKLEAISDYRSRDKIIKVGKKVEETPDPGTGTTPTPDPGTNPDPGTGNGGTTPDPGTGGGGTTPDPGTGNGGTTPDPGTGGGGTTPDPGTGGGGTTPDPGTGGSGTTPDPGSGEGA